ncbi:hypothetical protein LEN26_019562 [Aphanomyces euteiches]|nr:hypothetical protein LEN26_019562 [Aphanomyces euteiches]KAH9123685.1 hypothetical protein AeMF1_005408 [Aphanomyces euteiches]KAH9182420.1 hypothetical protein AeNC1_015605 [Aphanomyces euteiches]
MEFAHVAQQDYSTFETKTVQSDKRNAPQGSLRLVAGILALVGVVCFFVGSTPNFQNSFLDHVVALADRMLSYPVLKVTLNFKRETMYYYDQSSVDVYLVRRTTRNINDFEYDGVLELTHDDITERYLFVDNRAYYSQTNGSITNATCLAQRDLPSFSTLASILSGSKPVDRATIAGESIEESGVDENAQLRLVNWAGEPFLLHIGSGDHLSQLTGDDMDIVVDPVDEHPSLDLPPSPDGKPWSCDPIQPTQAPATEAAEIEISSDNERIVHLNGPECPCNGERKHCLFVHGLLNPEEGPIASEFQKYWGDIHKNVPCCLSTNFVQMDTIKHGWNEDILHKTFCDAALNISGATKNKSTIVGPLNLITHSMGNLIVGAAVARRNCTLSQDVTWISSAGPMHGSQGVGLLAKLCQAGHLTDPAKVPDLFKTFCPLTPAFESLYYIDSANQRNSELMIKAQEARKNHRNKKVICGTSGFGVLSWDSLKYLFLSNLISHKDLNDGAVSLESCVAGLEDGFTFGELDSRTHYKGRMNHGDLAFAHGDGWCKDSKPVKWLSCAL